jgi:hypothetical protein
MISQVVGSLLVVSALSHHAAAAAPCALAYRPSWAGGSQPSRVSGRSRQGVACRGECSGWSWKHVARSLLWVLLDRDGAHVGVSALGPAAMFCAAVAVLCLLNHASTCFRIVLGIGHRWDASKFSHVIRLHSLVEDRDALVLPLWYSTACRGIVLAGNVAGQGRTCCMFPLHVRTRH